MWIPHNKPDINTIQKIENLLREKFVPEVLTIQDMSAQHKKHSTYTGGFHLEVDVVSPYFEGMSLLERHRLVYRLLEEFFPEIHALRLRLHTPKERKRQVEKPL